MQDQNRPTPKRFEIQQGIRQLRVERHRSIRTPIGSSIGIEETDGWCIWLMANATYSIGTYLLLRDDGRIQRVTIQASGEEYVFDYEGSANES